jgi:hypothetical protein
MLIDCFPYFNEKELLELRINVLKDYVDGFINVDAEPVATNVYAAHPEMNIDKIYSDAFVQTSGAGGERYPAVYDANTDRIERGSLITNYVGHGGEVGAAEERSGGGIGY